MIKRILPLVLVAIMALGLLTGCNSGMSLQDIVDDPIIQAAAEDGITLTVEGNSLVYTWELDEVMAEVMDAEGMLDGIELGINVFLEAVRELAEDNSVTIIWRIVDEDGEVLGEREFD